MSAQRTALGDGRWHLNHGPIDLIAEAHGDAVEVAVAHEQVWRRFAVLLDELVAELPLLRRPVADGDCPLRGPVARRMWEACAPFRPAFITSMAAVAGSVADEIIALYRRPGIARAWVNNGGDIAQFDLADAGPLTTDGQFSIDAADPVRGVATSGWRGRSFSLGIADSVTVLAATAAQADAAATIIANAVNVDDPAIRRLPASQCKDDSDLGDSPVTVDVPLLAPATVRRALDAGAARARDLQKGGHAWAAMLVCQGQWRLVEPLCSITAATPRDAVGSVFA